MECGVCPRACRISEDERGTCGTRENRKGKLYTLVHSRPCSLAVDPVEKKPFFHVLPGATALSLATAGCNLECRCCQNWEIAQARPEQVPSMTLTPADVVMLAKQKGAPPRGLHLQRARRLLRVRARHRRGGAGRRACAR